MIEIKNLKLTVDIELDQQQVNDLSEFLRFNPGTLDSAIAKLFKSGLEDYISARNALKNNK